MGEQYLRTVSVEIEGGKTFTYVGDQNGGQGLRITFETTQKDANGSSMSTTTQQFRIDGAQCLVSR